jgi:hypothetical protein
MSVKWISTYLYDLRFVYKPRVRPREGTRPAGLVASTMSFVFVQ